MFERRFWKPGFLLLVALSLFGMLGCSGDEENIVAPLVVDDPWTMSLVRTEWFWASAPFFGMDYLANNADLRSFDPEDRTGAVRWFIPRERTLCWYLNPELTGQDRDKTQPTMELFFRADDGSWDAEDWGGIMRGVGRDGLDLSTAQFVEIWLNDECPDINLRRGRLHIDFGYINEDGFWPRDNNGQLVVGEWEREDGILPGEDPDGVWVSDEDIGLDGNENGIQRFAADYEIDDDSPYPRINGTARNLREDDEDINGDASFNVANGYFTATIDMKETRALVDVVYDYDDVQELVAGNIAWRKYHISMALMDEVRHGMDPDLGNLTHVRIWYEDPEPGGGAIRRLQISGFKFVDVSN